jgi:hypothetical protein
MENKENNFIVHFFTNDKNFDFQSNSLSVPSNSTVENLNCLLVALLNLKKDEYSFQFLVNNELLDSKKNLQEFFEKHGLTSELDIGIEYFLPSFSPPEKQFSVQIHTSVLSVECIENT